MKKFYQITGTNIFGATKEELKSQRNQLNADALKLEEGKKLSDTNSNTWPFRIAKGPEHPSLVGQ